MKRKVLIVEDNINLSQMQKDWFVQAGYDAITAVDATKARSLIRKVHFDLILSDVRLPDGDGISLLEWLRKEKNNTPFIITTEYVSVPYYPTLWCSAIRSVKYPIFHISGIQKLSDKA